MFYKASWRHHMLNINPIVNVMIMLIVTIMYGKQLEEKVIVIVHINTSKHFFLVKTLIDQVVIMMHFPNGKLDHYYNGSILLVPLLGCWVGIFL